MGLNEQQLTTAIKSLTDDNATYIALKQLFEQQINLGVDALTPPSQNSDDRHWNAGYVYSLQLLLERIDDLRKAKIE